MSKTIFLVDDERNFADGREAVIARSSWEAIEISDTLNEVDELWLDFNLTGSDDVMAFLWHLVTRKNEGNPLNVKRVIFHSAAFAAMSLIQHVGDKAGLPVIEWPDIPATSKLIN